jgi:hypothetical protein
MSSWQRPPWWPLFIRVERVLGTRLEDATRSDEFADVITRIARVQAALRGAYRAATADALHRVNLPAWSDLLELRDQIAALERKVADLALDAERAGARPRSSRRRPRSSAR